MAVSNGGSSLAKKPSATEFAGLAAGQLTGPLTGARLAFLIGLGVLTIALREMVHYPLKMPGHHGLEAMALLVIGRLSCTHRWSATIVCLSAAATAGWTGSGHNAMTALLHIAPGVFLDLFVVAFAGWRSKLLVLPVLVAFAFATKPLIRYGADIAWGIKSGSITKFGVLYPFSTHLIYGFTGALIAVLLWKATVRRVKSVDE
ncbi:MAG: hypothetical protein K2Y05_04660 [Hyphomicrobiaceae bacterium]|nr:hypothetical protein [Hyphomicrobiaceae bacterium]